MESRHRARFPARAAALLLWGLWAATQAVAEGAEPTLPGWQALVFEQRGYGVTARSRVELDRHPVRDDGALLLRADSAVSNNTESIELTLEAGDAGVLRRTRLSRGRDQRYKTFDYLPDHVLRVRREPDRSAGADPERWPVSSRREIGYPAEAGDLVITDAYALLLLAGRLQAGPEDALEVAVHTDFNFYRVRMTRGAVRAIPVDYRVAGGDRREQGSRDAREVILEITDLGVPEDKPDFYLLGLQGDISLLYQEDSGVLVQARGRAPRVGYTTLQLREVKPRDRDT